MKIVKHCDSLFNAGLIQGRLANEGIESYLLNEYSSSMLPYGSSIASVCIQVAVAEGDYERACELLSEDPVAEKCPDCGSEDIVFSFAGMSAGRRFLLKYVMFPISLLSGSAIGPARRTYICQKCGCQF